MISHDDPEALARQTSPGPVSLAAIVLAAGAGSRMRSRLPKPLHCVGGAPLIAHALRSLLALAPDRIVVVVGEGEDQVGAAAGRIAPGAILVDQPERRGTGDAVRCALNALADFSGRLVIVYADTPFLSPQTLCELAASPSAATVLGFEASDPGGYGRLALDGRGQLARIVEAADATPEERAISLCNAGAMGLDADAARRWIAALRADNAKGEFYLTDVIALARAEGADCAVARCAESETLGVNSRADLSVAEAAFQRRARSAAMAGGATLIAPETVFFSFDTALGRDVTVGPHVVFGPGVRIEDNVEIGAFCHLEGCVIRSGGAVGPFARLRSGAEIRSGARIGNFVEVKNAVIGEGAKANHLAYLGDAAVGADANIGAGTITCNYDGRAKHRTEIGAGAFVGSNSALVAPVRIGDGAYVGSGSVVTCDVPDDALAIGRARQINRPGLAARLRARLGAPPSDRETP